MTVAYQIKEADAQLSRTIIERRPLGSRDVRIDLKFCGICHSDLVAASDKLGGGIFPMVPGHEMVGTISEIERSGRFRCWRRSGRRMHC